MSDFYLWDGTSIELEPGKELPVFLLTILLQIFYSSSNNGKKNNRIFLKEMPGVIYPYPQITVFNGDGGMEFPMIVNDGQFSNTINDVYVTTHEIAHMYFPFYVGTNETRYGGWMKEWLIFFHGICKLNFQSLITELVLPLDFLNGLEMKWIFQ
jgi:hypothetical protein